VALTSLALEGAWLVGRARLAVRREHHRLPPAGRGQATYLTSVVRIPAEVAGRLAPALERLRARAPQHHFYEADSLHVTVRNLDVLSGGDIAAARSAIASHPPFELEARGLSLSPHTVFVAVWPADATLRSLRRELAAIAGGTRGALPDLAFANVVRFSGRVESDFVRELARLRRLELGSWLAREVELVRTDRLLSREGTEVLERVELASGE
jgi:2'-5' RNA ligase